MAIEGLTQAEVKVLAETSNFPTGILGTESLFPANRPYLSRLTDILKDVPDAVLNANFKDQSAREELFRRHLNNRLGQMVRFMTYERRKKAKELNNGRDKR